MAIVALCPLTALLSYPHTLNTTTPRPLYSHLNDYDFDLPDELIAQVPALTRSSSRLLDLSSGKPQDRQFQDILQLLQAGDLLVFNDTKVIKARLYGQKGSGGKVECLVERITSETSALVQLKSSKTPQTDSVLNFADGYEAKVKGRAGEFFVLEFNHPVLTLLDAIGVLPLPPYVTHLPTTDDEARYQTVYAREPGAVAAPTAGLHFDETLLASLKAKGVNTAFVTLHVGAGTFQPVRVDDLSLHKMHSERYQIPAITALKINAALEERRRIICVGTTSLRTLEGAVAAHGVIKACEGETDIFITPGFIFRVANALVTNFHLPKSTLMMLVCAFGGYDQLKASYQHAIAQRYRFFSFGDAMFITKNTHE